MRFRNFTKIDPESIERVRQKVVTIVEQEEYKNLVDERDVKHVQNHDWFPFRFLVPVDGDEEIAASNLLETLKWRKSHDFKNFRLNSLPDTFFKMGGIFQYDPDKWGHRTIHMRVKFLRKVPELRPVLQDICDYILWQVDEASGDSGWILVLDFDGAGLQNAEFDILRGLISSLKTHFPCGLDFILVVDLPWILRAFWTMVKSWIDSKQEDLIKFVSRKNLAEYFEAKDLPDFMDGSSSQPYCGRELLKIMGINGQCPTLFDYCQNSLKLPADRCKAIEKIYKPYLETVE